jgi:hypothetical protein
LWYFVSNCLQERSLVVCTLKHWYIMIVCSKVNYVKCPFFLAGCNHAIEVLRISLLISFLFLLVTLTMSWVHFVDVFVFMGVSFILL